MRKCEKSHPWLTFAVDLSRASHRLWMGIGAAQSKCEHIANTPLMPGTSSRLHQLLLAKGVRATTAIEGNTLSEEEVRQRIEGRLRLPPSREYLGREVDNILGATNEILRRTLEESGRTTSVERIQEYNRWVLHGLELEGGVVPGAIPTHDVHVGGYTGAPPEDCHYLLERLREWMNESALWIPGDSPIPTGLLKAILAHLYLALIHPFGDGNGRTARLMEYEILVSAGVPSAAAHLLSNHYNQTREHYYRHLGEVSRPPYPVLGFVEYAVEGFVDGLAEHLDVIRAQEEQVVWRDYVNERFHGKTSEANARRRDVAIALWGAEESVPLQKIPELNTDLARRYGQKTGKTLSRDLNALIAMGLVARDGRAYRARTEIMRQFLPPRVAE